MSHLRPLLKDVRVWLLVIFVLLSVIAINPKFTPQGVALRQVVKESAAEQAGIKNPDPRTAPTQRERILDINGKDVRTIEDYYAIVENYPANTSMRVVTTQGTYTLLTPSPPAANATQNATAQSASSGADDLGLVVYDAPRSNIKLGLDLSGGTRVILKPEQKVSKDDLDLIIENIKERLNVYGLSDIVVRDARDLSGDDFIVVEIAGANKDEVRELLGNQGKFEAKIGNSTVFRGGNDITYVCRTAECSGIDRNAGCGQAADGWACRFSFEIQLSPDAAARQGDLTRDLTVIYNESTQGYLERPLDLYLDNGLVDSLHISADLKGKTETHILISGSGTGVTQQAAAENAIANMKTLQTVLITGSLPVKLDIVKSDGISPALGGGFVRNAALLMILSIFAVTAVIVARYRRLIVSIPVIVTMLAEVIIVLGFAAAVGWNMDLASIAAIIIAIGSGVDDQIVLIDETLESVKSQARSWKEKVSAAFFIIFASYFTLAAAMVPLFFAGAGLLRGFAITTVVGVTAGVLITRPAFARFIEALLKRDEES